MSAVPTHTTGSILAGNFGFSASLPSEVPSSGTQLTEAASATAPSADASDEAFPTLEDVMRKHIIRALGLTRGRVEGRGGAADRLGINPHTLRGKMRRLGIEWSRFRA